jgi:hypothetical protein
VNNVTVSSKDWFINATLPSGSYASYLGLGSSDESWFTMNTSTSGFEIILAATFLPNSKSSESRFVQLFRDTGCTTEYDNNTWARQGVGGSGAVTYNLQPCVRTYNASIERGELQETLLATYANMFFAESNTPVWRMADLGCAGADARSQLQQAGSNITDQTTLIPWNVEVEPE